MYQAVSSRRHNSIPSINNLSCKGLAGTPFAEKHKPHLSVAGLASMAAVAGHTLVTETLQFIGSSLMRMQDDKIKTPEHIRLLQQFAFSKNLSWKKLSNFICAH